MTTLQGSRTRAVAAALAVAAATLLASFGSGPLFPNAPGDVAELLGRAATSTASPDGWSGSVAAGHATVDQDLATAFGSKITTPLHRPTLRATNHGHRLPHLLRFGPASMLALLVGFALAAYGWTVLGTAPLRPIRAAGGRPDLSRAPPLR